MIDEEYMECRLCPNDCRVDRTRGRMGICRQGSKTKIAWSGLHRGEEPPISGENGSGMIFFTGCPLHCAYCQNRQISGSDGENWGFEIEDEELVSLMLSLEEQGAASINLVTGTHFVPTLKRAIPEAKRRGLSLPIVWNSSGYESIRGLELIDDCIDLYLLDCKTLSSRVASVFCGRKEYARSILPVMNWIKERHGKTDLEKVQGTVVRHLVFPGTVEASRHFLEVFAEKYKDSFALSLMCQFVPPKEDPGLLPISDEEYESLLEKMEELGIEEGFEQEKSDDDILWIPDFSRDVPFPSSFADPNPYFLSLKKKYLSQR